MGKGERQYTPRQQWQASTDNGATAPVAVLAAPVGIRDAGDDDAAVRYPRVNRLEELLAARQRTCGVAADMMGVDSRNVRVVCV